MAVADRPAKVPGTAQPAFGGALWADGNDLYIRKGKISLTPEQIRGMTDHLQSREELTEFWARNLKEYSADVVEAVVDYLKPPDVRPPMVGNLLPPDEPETVSVVASAPVQVNAVVPPTEVQREAENYDRPMESKPPVGVCEHGTTEFFIAAEDEKTTAIVKAAPPPAVREEDRWWNDPEVMDIVKNIVGRGATDTQVKYLIQFSKALGLNPLIGETRWNSFLGKPVIDRDGYVSHANRHPQFRGLISGIVYEGDEFEFDAMGRVDADGPRGIVIHRRSGARDPAKIQFAYAVVYRHDREFATYYEAPMKEFMPGGYTDPSKLSYDQRKKQKFDAYPGDKLLAKAQRKAIARAFNLGALTEEDIRDGDTGE